MVRKTWSLCDSQEHIKLYNNIVHQVQKIGYLEGATIPPLYWLKNNNRALGKCSYYMKSDGSFTSDGICIHIGYKNLPVQDALETLVHEIVHFCSIYKYGLQGTGHKYYFHTIAKKFSQIFNIALGTHAQNMNIVNALIQPSKEIYHYEVYCSKCGKVIQRYKRWNKHLEYSNMYIHTPCGKQAFLNWRKI